MSRWPLFQKSTSPSANTAWRSSSASEPGPPLRKTSVLFLFFFLVIAAFWIQKPIRTSRFITAVGAEYLPLAKFLTAAAIFPLAAGFALLTRRFRRRSLALLVNAAFLVGSLAFWRAFRSGAALPAWAHFAFFSYVDVFNTLLVTLFWSVANDVCSPAEARRSFGIVGLGGILGGVAGSAFTGWTVGSLGADHLLLACAFILAALLGVSAALPDSPAAVGPAPAAPPGGGAPVLEGVRMVLRSRYLISIASIVGFYELISVIVDYQFNTAAGRRFGDERTLAAFLGKFSSSCIALAGLFQAFGTTAILRRWGPRVGLLVLPVLLLSGTAAYLLAPSFALLALLFASDAVFHYSVNQSSKEALYSSTAPHAKYEAKAFIDIFFFRLAKGLAAGLVWIASWLFLRSGWDVPAFSWISLAALFFWLRSARYAGKKFLEHENILAPPAAVRPPVPAASAR